MTDIEILMHDRADLLQHFNLAEYPKAFQRYQQNCSPVFECMDEALAENTVSRLLTFVRDSTPKLWQKNVFLSDMQRFLLLYLIPAAMESERSEVRSFGELLRNAWNGEYPAFVMGELDYNTIVSGFNTKIMGISFRRRKK